MVDIAKLGLSIDTDDLEKGIVALNALVPAAQRASAAALSLAKADESRARAALNVLKATEGAAKADIAAASALVKKAVAAREVAQSDVAIANAAATAAAENRRLSSSLEAAATGGIKQASASRAAAAGVTAQGNAAAAAASKLDRLGASANDNINRLQSTPGNIAAQFQDIGVTAAGGMNPLLIALQQGTQLSAAMQGGIGSLKEALGQVFNAATIGTVTIVALVAGLIQLGISFFSSGDAAGEAKNKFVDLTSATDRQAASKRDLIAAIEDYNKAQARSNDGTRYAINLALQASRADLLRGNEKRKLLQAELELMRVSASANAGQGTFGAAGAFAGIQVLSVEGQLAENQKLIDGAAKEIVNHQIEIARINAAVSVDPARKIAEHYKDAAAHAEAIARANKGMVNGVPIADVLKNQARMQALEENGIRQRGRAARESGGQRGRAARESGTREYFGSPVSGGRITGVFGEPRKDHIHGGIDYAVPTGTAVRAVASGVVSFAGGKGRYGNTVDVDTGGAVTRDAHLSSILVKLGQVVEKGQLIGYSGGERGAPGAGNSRGPHVHHEVRVGGKAVNPLGRYGVDQGAASDAADRAAVAIQRQADALKRAQDATDSYITSASSGISSISARWDEQPKLIDQIAADTRALDAEMEKINQRAVEDHTLTDEQRSSLTALYVEGMRVRALVADGMSKPLREVLEGNTANQADMKTQISLIGKYGHQLAYATEMASLLKSAIAKGMTPEAIAKAMPKFEIAARDTADKSVSLSEAIFNDDLDKRIEEETAALKRQRGEFGLSEKQLMAYRYETDVAAEATRRGITLTDEQTIKIRAASEAYADQTLELRELSSALDFVRDGVKGFVSQLRSDLEQGKNFFSAFGSAVLSILNKIIDKLLDTAFNAALGGGGGGTNGLLDAIVKVGTSLFGGTPAPSDTSGVPGYVNAKGNAFDGGAVTAFAKGGAFTNSVVSSPTLFKFAKGTGLMGEAGPEAIMPLKRGPDGSLGVQSIGANDNRRAPPAAPTININNNYTISGSSTADMQATVRQSAEQTRDQLRRAIPQVLDEYQRNGTIA